MNLLERRTTRRPRIVLALCGAIVLVGCVQDSIREMATCLDLKIGDGYAAKQGSSLGFRVVEVAPDGHRALLDITNASERTSQQGWVAAGEYAEFTPWTGTRGMQLLETKSNSAVIELRWAESGSRISVFHLR